MELGMAFTADAVENSRVVENNGELQFVTSKSNRLALREDDLQKAISKISPRPMRIKIVLDESVGASAPAAPLAAPAGEDEVTARALSNPEVQRFREVFGGEVRKVRNLKES
jgi:hypothetical protein